MHRAKTPVPMSCLDIWWRREGAVNTMVLSPVRSGRGPPLSCHGCLKTDRNIHRPCLPCVIHSRITKLFADGRRLESTSISAKPCLHVGRPQTIKGLSARLYLPVSPVSQQSWRIVTGTAWTTLVSHLHHVALAQPGER